jgi:hypothetical protein
MNFSLSSTEISKLVYSKFGVQLDGDSAQSQGGSVSVTSNPSGADIEVDGIFVGTSPAELPISSGERTVRITKKGFDTFERKMQIVAGGKQTISADLESNQKTQTAVSMQTPARPETSSVVASKVSGTISVISNPSGASIYIDDSFKGKAPATFELKQGQHYVRMFMAAYKNWSQQITVVGGSELKLAATLEKSQ